MGVLLPYWREREGRRRGGREGRRRKEEERKDGGEGEFLCRQQKREGDRGVGLLKAKRVRASECWILWDRASDDGVRGKRARERPVYLLLAAPAEGDSRTVSGKRERKKRVRGRGQKTERKKKKKKKKYGKKYIP